jgi:peroxin-16
MEAAQKPRLPVPAVLLQPSKWLPLYEDFVTKNASSIGQVESALRSLTYIIPGMVVSGNRAAVTNSYLSTGRYRDSEIPSECGMSTCPKLSTALLNCNYSAFGSTVAVVIS